MSMASHTYICASSRENLALGFPTRSDTNPATQPQKMTRVFQSSDLDLCSENKGADQLHGYREADLRLCFAYAK